MSLIVFNGSPRGKKSNSSVITSWFTESYLDEDITIRYLNSINHHETYAEESTSYDQILFVFPLYVDGMPGQVKQFFEILSNYREKLQKKRVTYIIHSGFSEAIQSRSLEKYLVRFSEIMDFTNHAVVIIPGSEGFRLMPPSMTKKKRLAVARLGEAFQKKETYLEQDISFLEKREKTSKRLHIVYWIFSKLGLTNSYWNSQLKRNNAMDKVFDAPYLDSPTFVKEAYYLSNKK